jgi:hypothetical protein
MNDEMMETAENKGEQLDDNSSYQNNEFSEIINRLTTLAFAYCPVPLNS